jgi:DNA polymerase-1
MKQEFKLERTALIDGDIIAFETAAWAASAQADVLAMTERLTAQLADWTHRAFCTKQIVTLSCAKEDGFRRGAFPLYKQHRTTEPPPMLEHAKLILKEHFGALVRPGLEADDIMGILATNGKVENPVIVSIDKDMRQIPGWLFNPNKMDFPEYIHADDGYRVFLTQWMTGDTSDGYKGMDKCGPAKAEKLLADWDGTIEGGRALVVAAYVDHPKGYTPQYVEQMGTVARILTAGDWDGEKRKPLPFTLTSTELEAWAVKVS